MRKCICCGRSYDEYETVFFSMSGEPGKQICENCIRSCSIMLENIYSCREDAEKKAADKVIEEGMMNPVDLKRYFDDYIVKQESAKRMLSSAVCSHYKRVLYNNDKASERNSIKLKKANVLMVGPSGSGKTLFIEKIAEKLNIPYVIQDATALTQAGYMGEDVSDMLKKLIDNADGSVELAERGIIFIDEIDKIARVRGEGLMGRDVSGAGVQEGLLKAVEGDKIRVVMNKETGQYCDIDTSNILFICGGAFQGIEDIIKERIYGRNTIGFSCNTNSGKMSYNELIHNLSMEDLISFGMMPEFIGRLPVICTMDKLSEEDFIDIMVKPKDSIIRQSKIIFKMDGIEAQYDEEALKAIAHKALSEGTGARGLRTIIENITARYTYMACEKNMTFLKITKECIS